MVSSSVPASAPVCSCLDNVRTRIASPLDRRSPAVPDGLAPFVNRIYVAA
ncbi:hypothetical protein [Azospirillum melinis]